MATETASVDPDTGELLGYERTLLRLTDPDYFSEWVPGEHAPLRTRTPGCGRLQCLLRG